MGAEQNYVLSSIAPMSDEERWEGKVTRQTPADGWQKEGFNDAEWKTEKAAWGSEGENISSRWGREGSDIYIRREVDLTAEQLKADKVRGYVVEKDGKKFQMMGMSDDRIGDFGGGIDFRFMKSNR